MILVLLKFLRNKDVILTQSKKFKSLKKVVKMVRVKYSTFVNSGSSANFITISPLKLLIKKKVKMKL